jgi:hypothetical protein
MRGMRKKKIKGQEARRRAWMKNQGEEKNEEREEGRKGRYD